MMKDFYGDQVFSGKISVDKIIETNKVLAYHHTNPHWPVHIVVVPKQHVTSLLTLTDNDLILELINVIKKVAADVTRERGECRILTNLGNYQESKHLHFHVYAGEVLQ